MFDFKEFKPPTIPRFLCFNLVTGNLVAAWLHFAGCIFIFAGLLFFLITNKSEVKGEGFEIKVDDASIDENSDAFTGTLHVVVALVTLVVVAFIAFITFWFIHGINRADPSKMKPYIILSLIYVIFAVISTVASLNFFVLVHALIEIYFFVAAYSLYYSFVNETAAGNMQQVVYANPTAHGYERAYEPDYDEGEGQGYQQENYGNYEMQQQQQSQGFDQFGAQQQQPQQQQYYQQ